MSWRRGCTAIRTRRIGQRTCARRQTGTPRWSSKRARPVTEVSDGLRKKDSSRRQPGTPSGFYQTQHKPETTSSSTSPAPVTELIDAESDDLGIALNDYLLERLQLTEQDALYEASRISLRRKRDNAAVSIFTKVLGDLSRLGTGGLLALSTLYQLFFISPLCLPMLSIRCR